MANASVRNRWINDELLQVRSTHSSTSLGLTFVLQARLLSLTPLPIQNSFAMIHKSRIPDDVKRGYLFEQAVSRLASWWAGSFTVKPAGHLRSRTFEEVQGVLLSKGLLDITGKGKGKALPEDIDPLEDLLEDDEIEIVRSAKSLMKHALMRSGSRDVSSQLFTALCRALGIPARLVVSLQSVPWQTNVGRSKTPAKHKGKSVELHDAEDNSEDLDMEGVSVSRLDEYSSEDDMQVDEDVGDKISSPKPNGKGKMSYTVKLRKNKSPGKRLGPGAPFFFRAGLLLLLSVV
jgi:xeroderma pigmentosum group C-complementing protein